MKIDTEEIKKKSEAKVLAEGGEICDWLPWIEFSQIRPDEEVIARALILNAMLNIHFKAPTEIISDWIERHNLESYLSNWEIEILQKKTEDLSDQESTNLYWYIEALWAFLWATNIVDDLDFTVGIPDSMASFCPNLQINESDEKFTNKMELRDYDEIYTMRDLYYRVMWYSRHLSLQGKNNDKFDMSRTLERRRALTWILDSSLDWDDVPQDT